MINGNDKELNQQPTAPTTPQMEDNETNELDNSLDQEAVEAIRRAESSLDSDDEEDLAEVPVLEDTDEDDDLIDAEELETLRKESESIKAEQEEEEQEERTEDFSTLSKEELVAKSALFAAQSKEQAQRINFRYIDDAMNKIRELIDARTEQERNEARQRYEAAAESEEEKEGFVFQQDALTTTFYENYKAVKEAKRNYYQRLENEKQANLKKKQAFIEELRRLTDTTQQSGLSRKGEFDRVKTIQNEWKNIGAVPIQEAEELYKNYKALLDLFYNQKSQERELLALDRQRNYEAKKNLVERAKELANSDSIKDAVAELNRLHQEYKRIGPVPRAEREALWQQFKEASDKIYERRRAYAEEFKAQLQENMKLKQEYCLKVEEFLSFDSDRIRDWNEKTKEIVELQKEWDAIGPAPREVAKSINKQFWDNFKQFFANKSKFFEKLDAERAENLAKKQELVKRAQELKDSSDWDTTANQLKALQEEWRTIGPVPEKYRQTVYKEFKDAADYFFERRRNRYKEQDKEYEQNLAKKQAICKQIVELTEANITDLSKLEALHLEFHKIGFVPRKNIRTIQDKLAEATDKFLTNAGLSDKEKQDFFVRTQTKAVKQNPKMAGQFKQSEKKLERRIADLESDINLWKNNIEFFAKSKTADKLREEFNQKIAKAQNEIDRIKAQLEALNMAVNREKAEKEQVEEPSKQEISE